MIENKAREFLSWFDEMKQKAFNPELTWISVSSVVWKISQSVLTCFLLINLINLEYTWLNLKIESFKSKKISSTFKFSKPQTCFKISKLATPLNLLLWSRSLQWLEHDLFTFFIDLIFLKVRRSDVTNVTVTTTRDAPRKFHQKNSNWSAAQRRKEQSTRSAEKSFKSLNFQSTTVSCQQQKSSSRTNNSFPFSVPPDTRTIRTCAFEEGNYKNRCYQRSGFGGRQEVCACDTDLCNGAATIKATFGVLLAAIVVLVARA